MHVWASRVARDWPAFSVEERGGWRFGFAEGVTKRANSALLLDPAADAAEVTAYYGALGLRPCAQVWPGQEGADARLAGHGYEVVEPSLVLARELDRRPEAPGTTAVSDVPTDDWRVPEPDSAEGTARILGRVRTAYGAAPGGAGRGCAVLDGGSVAICAMATAPRERGRGVAAAVLADLLRRAYDGGARSAYLCVVADNTPALRLYRRAGFREVSRYHYRVLG
ncbi:GNAT family N-acetyltransferase [Nocardiopsis algeriensis]|uniref:Ribosomal protein S18 acetylase RimI-like enzyme n=1 Tax=Nocardiopsis algeriensis TaxID=1478215 RepID=A0A841IK73_9ACTN|nr:GNAT family N-acetyltransferase [Nocardiopsis algeriensis]MBB6119117.1 ribosomal protein S18 acetylase RimI-like enzyme [Nocardiopsis algeriensis]